MLDAAGDDEEVAGGEVDVAVAELDRQVAVEDEEGLVLVVVGVPGGGADALGDLEEVAVGLGDEVLGPVFGEGLGDGGERGLGDHEVIVPGGRRG